MSYDTNISLLNIPNNISASEGYAYLAYDIDHGFRVIVPIKEDNRSFYRDLGLTDVGADGVVDTADAVVSVEGSRIDVLSGALPTAKSVFKMGNSWVEIQSYLSDKQATINKSFPSIKVTSSSVGTPGVLTTSTDHGLSVNDRLTFKPVYSPVVTDAGAVPYPLGDGTADSGVKGKTLYYVGTTPSSTTFTLSTTTSNGNPVEIVGPHTGVLGAFRVYDLYSMLYESDELNDTIVGRINKSGSTYTLEQYYSVDNSKNVPVTISESLPASGSFIGEVALIGSKLYIWNGTAWQLNETYTVILTNEAHALPVTSGVVDYTGSGTDIVVYKGNTQLDSVTGTPGDGEFSVTAVGTDITAGTISVTGLPAVVSDHSNATETRSSVEYTINIEDEQTFTKIQSISKTAEGQDPQYVAVSGEQIFSYASGASIPSPTSITLSASLFGGLTTYDWEYWNGSSWVNLPGTQDQSTYSLAYNNSVFTGNSIRIRCLSGTAFDELTVVKVFDGADGTDGVDGATGPAGVDGTDGVDGATGPAGATGPQGATGPAGADGATGPAGADGKRTAAGQVFYQLSSATAPSTPAATSYNFSNNTFTGLTANWGTSPPTYQAGNANKYWYSTFTAVETTAGGGTATPTFSSTTQGFGFSGLVTFSGSNLSDGTSTYNPATVINAGVTTIDGDQITTGSILATKMNVGNLSAISASLGTITAGTIRSGTTGERLVITEDVITVFDASNNVRIKLGNLS